MWHSDLPAFPNAAQPGTAQPCQTTYAEAAYFEGAPVAHCAAWAENARLRRIAAHCRAAARASRHQRHRAS